MTPIHPADLLDEHIERTGSIVCLCLDPRPDLIPAGLVPTKPTPENFASVVGQAYMTWLGFLIHAAVGRCCAIKFSMPAFEVLGVRGFATLAELTKMAKKLGHVVILDGRYSDGLDTAHLRRAMVSGSMGSDLAADWLTINPYMGMNSVASLVDENDKGERVGAFVTVCTANDSCGDMQDIPLAWGRFDGVGNTPRSLWEGAALKVNEWAVGRKGERGLSAVGATVGTNRPLDAKLARTLIPDAIFIATASDAGSVVPANAIAGIRGDGRGVIVEVGRPVIGAHRGVEGAWGEVTVVALDDMNDALNAALDEA